MNLEYEVTIEDDLDAQYTDWELSLQKGKVLRYVFVGYFLFIWVFGAGCIIWGFFEPVESDSYLLFGMGIFILIIGTILFVLLVSYKPNSLLYSFNRKSLQKQYGDYYAHKNRRNIILTETELIFKTSNSTMAWSWQGVKSFDEGSLGFRLRFFSGHTRFVSKKRFADRCQSDNFKSLVEQHINRVRTNEQ